ncbi:endonuclease/exonuclease/phosphatase family domain-containing protein 1-like [Saccostrea echinata]|uniref:endonuclease/exonuclease/phosphatase family domain-containing protein 1-like n=1 Tax=Saccostrea echinata TaxID=191078 RepID=UPI002A8363D0|nr:endonuclease/exonuclease/phosphatase family domain-containing protein 1-like [Saccostrea echinata]
MGAVNSCCIPKHIDSDSSTPKKMGHRRNLSAAFNMSAMMEGDAGQNLLNINYATEEELMTLPGINRATAQAIIEYRRKIGGFKKIEDVALVSGVGAVKLNIIRDEITLSMKRQGSTGPPTEENSPTGSRSDISFRSETSRKSNGKINVNSSNVFQLMKVKGIGQVLAENIVTYRDKKGQFKAIDDLIKVKGIGPNLLSAIRNQLSLDDSESSNNTQPNGHVPSDSINNGNASIPPKLSNNDHNHTNCRILSSSTENMLDILEPIIKSGTRPKVTPFNFKHKNRSVVRVASWNVERFDEEKANNIGVREVICMTILENGFGVVAFQELADKNSLQKICDELNNPTITHVMKWPGMRGTWKCVVSKATGRMYRSLEYNGFLYDTSQGISLSSSANLEKPASSTRDFVRRPFIGILKMKKFDCVMASVHLKATGLDNEDLEKLQAEIDNVPKVVKAIEEHYPGEKDIILLGDFNLEPDLEDFDCLRERGYTNAIPVGAYTNISNKNLKGSRTYDHIWITKETKSVATGNSGVVREGLTNALIPNGWSWGGVVSDHCPVWVELYTSKDLDKADLSIGAEAIKFTLGTEG